MAILTRSEYAQAVDNLGAMAKQFDEVSTALHKRCARDIRGMLECIATYRVICHSLAPLLHDAIAECDDPQELARLRGIWYDLKRGES